MTPIVVVASLLLLSVTGYSEAVTCSGGNSAISDADRQSMLDFHNNYRSLTAKGKAVNKDGSLMPAGKNIYKVTWDCTVEKSAQASADSNAVKCGMDHAQNTGYGENLFSAGGLAFVTKSLFNSSVNLWYSELASAGFKSANNLKTNATGIGHWTQVVWGSSKKIGCGLAKCKTDSSSVIISCQYSPQGNLVGAPIYELGTACQKTADCTNGGSCSVSDGLCVDDGTNPPVTTTSAPTANPNVVHPTLPNKLPDPSMPDVNGYGLDTNGVFTYSLWNGCKTDANCKQPNGLAGTCQTNGKCVDTQWWNKG